MTIWAFLLLGWYVTLVILMARRMRRMGAELFDLFAFAVNTGTIAWLVFLYMSFLSDELPVERLRLLHDSWIPWGCLTIAVLLIPGTIRSALLGVRRQQDNLTSEERLAARRTIRRQLPRTAVTLIIGASWLIFLGGRTFGYDRSHLWLILLGIGASAGLAWIVVALIERGQRQNSGVDK